MKKFCSAPCPEHEAFFSNASPPPNKLRGLREEKARSGSAVGSMKNSHEAKHEAENVARSLDFIGYANNRSPSLRESKVPTRRSARRHERGTQRASRIDVRKTKRSGFTRSEGAKRRSAKHEAQVAKQSVIGVGCVGCVDASYYKKKEKDGV